MRFRRRIRIAPGLYINVSGSGLSASVGPRGASLTLGKRGIFANTSLPGTGLYYRSKLTGSGPKPKAARSPGKGVAAAEASPILGGARLDFEAHTITLLDEAERPLPEHVVAQHWARWKHQVLPALEAAVAQRNAETEALGNLHASTPAPLPALDFQVALYPQAPQAGPAQAYHPIWRLLPWHRKRVDADNARAAEAHRHSLQEWQHGKAAFELREREREATFRARGESGERAEAFLADHLGSLAWPLETLVDVQASDDANVIGLDVDLPEIMMLPTGTYEVATRTRSLRVKPFSARAQNTLYQRLAHGTLFRLVGEIFHALPQSRQVIASGYTQRIDPATGAERDVYVLSLRVDRMRWSGLRFDALDLVDPVEALAAFELRREVRQSRLLEIEPWPLA